MSTQSKKTLLLKRLVIGVAGIVGLILGFLVYGSPWGFLGAAETKIGSLEEQIVSLQAELDAKNTQIAVLVKEVENRSAELALTVAAKDSQVSGLQGQIVEKEQKIAELQAKITWLEEQVTGKNSEILGLTQTILTLQSEIANLKQQMEQLDFKVLGIYFSPGGGCESQIINWIGRANVSIHVLTYCFASDPIANALLQAYNRSLDVKVVFEAEQVTPLSRYDKLRLFGIPVRIDTNGKKMNEKVMIIDGKIVLTGSMDWTTDADTFNNENLIVLSSAFIGGTYEAEFTKIWDMSQA